MPKPKALLENGLKLLLMQQYSKAALDLQEAINQDNGEYNLLAMIMYSRSVESRHEPVSRKLIDVNFLIGVIRDGAHDLIVRVVAASLLSIAKFNDKCVCESLEYAHLAIALGVEIHENSTTPILLAIDYKQKPNNMTQPKKKLVPPDYEYIKAPLAAIKTKYLTQITTHRDTLAQPAAQTQIAKFRAETNDNMHSFAVNTTELGKWTALRDIVSALFQDDAAARCVNADTPEYMRFLRRIERDVSLKPVVRITAALGRGALCLAMRDGRGAARHLRKFAYEMPNLGVDERTLDTLYVDEATILRNGGERDDMSQKFVEFLLELLEERRPHKHQQDGNGGDKNDHEDDIFKANGWKNLFLDPDSVRNNVHQMDFVPIRSDNGGLARAFTSAG
ncbi:hypothetical protein HK100_009773 [Physocladia obscura]|uniref:Uncharacterized protein n=1 Tax=Physocladia obscura TaxID=109957 RepID=A0AAD5XJ59_9FUNG|nr:hypothetical protein HK100_009773 [Physocladia obscura]